MPLYWMKCDWCGAYNVVKPCYLHPADSICYFTCIACRERSMCLNPAWSPGVGRSGGGFSPSVTAPGGERAAGEAAKGRRRRAVSGRQP